MGVECDHIRRDGVEPRHIWRGGGLAWKCCTWVFGGGREIGTSAASDFQNQNDTWNPFQLDLF